MATALRTPGVRFTVLPPASPATLPRMDIAGFVGFAACGPVDTPVPIEDPADFTALFGGDVLLGRDLKAGADVYSNLGPAVRAFFSDGGRRCWVVRVAREPVTTPFPLPGVLAVGSGGVLEPAMLAARSPGSWADGLSLTTALGSEPVAVVSASLDPLRPQLLLPAPTTVAPGDLLRVGGADGGCMGVVAAVSPPGLTAAPQASPPDPGQPTAVATVTASIDPGSLLSVRALTDTAAGVPQAGATGMARLDGGTATATLAAVVGSTVALIVGAGVAPEPGQLMEVDGLLAGEQLWLTVGGVFSAAGGVRVEGAGQLVRRGPPAAAPETAVERLTLDLLVRDADGGVSRLSGLGLAPGSGRFIGSLPSDETLLAPVLPGGPAGRPPGLWAEVTAPRWPLAAPAGVGVLYPVAAGPVPGPWLSPAVAGVDGMTRDGLASFDSRLFIDRELRTALTTALPSDGSGAGLGAATSMSDALLQTADYIRYTGPAPRKLTGLHGLLEIDEVTLACVPDAVHRGWTIGSRPSSGGAPAPVPPADTGAFDACTGGRAPAPTLSAPVGAGPPFELSWTSAGPGTAYVLEQAPTLGFGDASTVYEGIATSFVVHQLTTGSGSWFRVRAGGSDWSNAVEVTAVPASWAVIDSVEAYSDTALIEVQRALLRAAAARGDIFAALALPAHYRESQTLAHRGRLLSAPTAPVAAAPVPPLEPGELRSLSFGALYHPWTVLSEPNGNPLAIPADATAIAVMADRAAGPGAWHAPANVTLANAVALAPALSRSVVPPGAVPYLNVLSQEPRGFVCMSAWTLSDDPDLTDISVRRLLSLLRRVAVLWGPRYVFEPNDDHIVHTVSREFEALLSGLFTAGAFAGATPAESWALHVSSNVDAATLIVELGVAPSLPMRFLTVQLAQQWGGATTVGSV